MEEKNRSHSFKEKTRNASEILEDALQNFDNILENAHNHDEIMYNAAINQQSSEKADLAEEDPLKEVATFLDDIKPAIEEIMYENSMNNKQFVYGLSDHIEMSTVEFYHNLFENEQNVDENEYTWKIKKLNKEVTNLQTDNSLLNDRIYLQNGKIEDQNIELKQIKLRMLEADNRLQMEVKDKTNFENINLKLREEMGELRKHMFKTQQNSREKEIEQESINQLLKDELDQLKLEKEQLQNQLDSAVESAKLQMEGRTVSSKGNPQIVVNSDSPSLKLNKSPSFKTSPSDEGIDVSNENKIQSEEVNRIVVSKLKMPAPSATSTPTQPTQNKSPTHLKLTEKDSASLKSSTSEVREKAVHNNDKVASSSMDELLDKKTDLLPTFKPVTTTSSSQDVSSSNTSRSNLNEENQQEKDEKKPSSNSVPNLALNAIKPVAVENVEKPPKVPTVVQQDKKKSKMKIKNLFSFSLRRSRSTSLEGQQENEQPPMQSGRKRSSISSGSNFKRGGVRATTGGSQKTWNKLNSVNNINNSSSGNRNQSNASSWSHDEYLSWLSDIGLSVYKMKVSDWLKSGKDLLQISSHEIEKDLGIKNVLHAKKLKLHMQIISDDVDNMDKEMLDGCINFNSIWVARWLDDIGLAQYKESFNKSSIDGVMLHNMTVSDISKLGINNLFHLVSIRRAIEVLRTNMFDPKKYERRPSSDMKPQDYASVEGIEMWTCQRIMEWLRQIDLAEFATNLRGSGVHGAVMVLEPQFTGETLASLLHIQSGKTLIRRHVISKFDQLIPDNVKETKLKKSINIEAKYKIMKRSIFTRHHSSIKKQGHYTSQEFVAPIKNLSVNKMQRARSDLQVKIEMNKNNEDHPDSFNESTTRELGDFSKQLQTMTNQLSTSNEK